LGRKKNKKKPAPCTSRTCLQQQKKGPRDLSNVWCLILLCLNFRSILNLCPGCPAMQCGIFQPSFSLK
jgi:hypothetical protein